MIEILQQLLPQLTRIEKIEMLESLKEAIAEELASEGAPGAPSACPRCGCPRFSRKGRDRSGAQRWLCAGCARTFSASTKGLLANSKLGAAAWMEFAACAVDRVSLRESARRCGVCLSTAWFMRHRLCEVMGSRLMPFRVGKGARCQTDETVFDESLSGNWDLSAVSMPRKPHMRGRAVHQAGSSKQRISVLAGVNDRGDCFCELCCRGKSGTVDVERVLRGRIRRGAVVSSDYDAAYPKALEALGARHRRYCTASGEGHRINMVNGLHSRLDLFLRPFKGVATRRLQHYLDWFCFVEQFRKGDAEDGREALYGNAVSGTYDTVRKGYPSSPFPFGEYWGLPTVV